MREMSRIAEQLPRVRVAVGLALARKIVAIEGVDTRKLTRLVRTAGSLRCIVTTKGGEREDRRRERKRGRSTDGRDLTPTVTCEEPSRWTQEYDASYPDWIEKPARPKAGRVRASPTTSARSGTS
jgi:carbamoylphosphate synthase small subunit